MSPGSQGTRSYRLGPRLPSAGRDHHFRRQGLPCRFGRGMLTKQQWQPYAAHHPFGPVAPGLQTHPPPPPGRGRYLGKAEEQFLIQCQGLYSYMCIQRAAGAPRVIAGSGPGALQLKVNPERPWRCHYPSGNMSDASFGCTTQSKPWKACRNSHNQAAYGLSGCREGMPVYKKLFEPACIHQTEVGRYSSWSSLQKEFFERYTRRLMNFCLQKRRASGC
jgi:hypothetical protein